MEEVLKVKVIRPHILEIDYSDGKRREVDLGEELHGKTFEPLRDPEYFKPAAVDGGTVAWPNGTNFAPEFLYHDAKNAAKT